MKTLKNHLKVVTLFLSVLILFQGCTVYKSSSVTLDEAVSADTRIRIKTNDNQTLKFKNVRVENEIYTGFMYKKSKWVKTDINEDNIDIVQVKNKTLSTVLSIGIPIIILGGLLGIAAASCCDLSGASFTTATKH